MTTRAVRILWPTLLTISMAGGCAGAPVSAPAGPQEEAARITQSALLSSRTAADQPDSVTTRARLNPCACDVPEWELLWRGAWVRVSLRPAREASEAARLLLEGEAVGPGAVVHVSVSTTGRTDPRPSGLRYRIVELHDVLPSRAN